MKQVQLARGYVAVVDDADFEDVSRFKWHRRLRRPIGKEAKYEAARHDGAECIKGRWRSRSVTLSNHLMKAVGGCVIDHVNGDPLDNRRANLRAATPAQNAINWSRTNQTGYRGVFRNDSGYAARITEPGGKRRYLGTFRNPADAATAYDVAAVQNHGEFAVLNGAEKHCAVPT